MIRWPGGAAPRMAYGADYNPEQWPRAVWDDDVAAMQEAGVNVRLARRSSPGRGSSRPPDECDFEWLDEVMDLLHADGIAVDMATATASPPPWLTTAAPGDPPGRPAPGETVWPGSRQSLVPQLAGLPRPSRWGWFGLMAERLRRPPARWPPGTCRTSWAATTRRLLRRRGPAFRDWLRSRYGYVEALNHAWGTAFWSQQYGEWEQILPPRLAATHPNPTQQLDFARFSSDALLSYLRAERDVLRSITPDVPVTTNFMVTGQIDGMDYSDWAAEVDFVANDHYRRPGPQDFDELSFSRRPHRWPRRRAAVVPDGALDERGQLAAGQRARSGPVSWPATR